MTRLPSIAAFAVAAALTLPASAAEFRWSETTDPQTLDPHAAATAPVLGFLNNVYEGLVRRGRDMSLEPALAVSWEPLGAEGWRFRLREGVTFQNGERFDAEDVLFSWRRATHEESDVKPWFAPVREVVRVDDYTVDFLTHAPNPIFPDSIANFMIMDAGWAAAEGAEVPGRDEAAGATFKANGTGPFRVAEREPGIRTVLEPHEGWWDDAAHDIDRAVFEPRESAATMIAALLSGEVDLVKPAPLQDLPRLRAAEGVDVIEGVEARVIMLGFAHDREALLSGEPNVLRDPEVRAAIAEAIDVDAIIRVIMEGAAQPASQLVGAGIRGFSTAADTRPPHDPEGARERLEDAGALGTELTLACPNDRYINDEAVCQAIVSMLSKAGLAPRLEAMPVRQYWPELRAGNFDLYLLGWSPGTFDAEHPIRFLAATPNDERKLGSWNFGGYSSARVDELLPAIQSEIDESARQAMLDEVAAIVRAETAYVPLYVQPLAWAVREGVTAVQRPDDFLILRWVRIE